MAASSCTLRMKRLVYVWVAAAVVLLVSIGGTAAQLKSGEAAGQPKKILFLLSFDPNFEPWTTWGREIRNELNRQSPWPLVIQEQSLVTDQGGNDAAEAKFVEYLSALYAQRPPDLIVSLGGPAARFIQQHRADLFPTTPMLLAVVELRRVEQSMLSGQDAVVGGRVDQVALVENILRLLPETKAIAMIIGNSPNERFWVAEVQRELWPLLENKVELIFYNERPFGEILKAVASLPPHSAIFYQQLVVDGAGAVYGNKESLKRLSEVANAPIFSYDETYFNGELVGGPMVSPAEGARPTAAAAVRMLGGEKASGIKVPPIEFSTPKYDWRQLKRWDISESRLPPGSEVLFRDPTAWQRYSLANRVDHRRYSLPSRAYLGPAECASSASSGRSAVPAAHDGTCPCHPVFDRWRTDRLNRSRNQPAAWVYSHQRRNRTSNPEISKSRHRAPLSLN